MLKNGSLWAIYTASYFMDYIMILVILVWKKITVTEGIKDFIKSVTRIDCLMWIILTLLIVFSVLVMIGITKMEMTTRIKHEPKNDAVWETFSGFLAPALALVATFFGDYGMILSTVIFVVTGIAFVNSKQVYRASVFIFPLCYRIFKADNSVLITRDSRDGLRLRIAENPDGIEAKELSSGIFMVK